MFRFVNNTSASDLKDFTLIMPSVSVGNMPQLTVDLLICSLNCHKVASLWHPAISPLVSANPYGQSEDISTACELYVDKTRKLAVLQFRSSVEFTLAQDFFNAFKTALLDVGFRRVVILASAFDYDLRKVTSKKFRYVSTDETVDQLLSSMELSRCEEEEIPTNGMGFANRLFDLLKTDCECTLMIKHLSEGDNRPDAVAMFEILCKAKLFGDTIDCVKDVKMPHCWSFVFGKQSPLSIF